MQSQDQGSHYVNEGSQKDGQVGLSPFSIPCSPQSHQTLQGVLKQHHKRDEIPLFFSPPRETHHINVRSIPTSAPANQGRYVRGEVPHATSVCVERLPPIGTSTRATEEIASSADPDQQFKQQVLVILEMKQPISSCLLSLRCR